MNRIARNIILLLASFAIMAGVAFFVDQWAENQATPTLGTIKGIEVFALIFVASACFGQDVYEKAIHLYLLNRLNPNHVMPPKFNLVAMLVFVGTAVISGWMIYLTKS